jgi:hypothetical protein
VDNERSTHGEKINAYRILRGNPEKRDHLEDVDLGLTIILKLI